MQADEYTLKSEVPGTKEGTGTGLEQPSTGGSLYWFCCRHLGICLRGLNGLIALYAAALRC